MKKVILVIAIVSCLIILTACGEDKKVNVGYDTFVEQINDFTTNVSLAMDAIKTVAEEEEVSLTDAQISYMLANGTLDIPEEEVPTGETFEEYNFLEEDEVLYEIKSYELIEKYEEALDLYNDNNGAEKYYVTSYGNIYTLPGYPVVQENGSTRYYVSATLYYTK